MSPIRPENQHRYPPDWPDIAAAVKQQAGWQCECRGECGRGTHHSRCPNQHGQPAYGTGSHVVLTVAHLDHTPEHCNRSNLAAMCPVVISITTKNTTVTPPGTPASGPAPQPAAAAGRALTIHPARRVLLAAY